MTSRALHVLVVEDERAIAESLAEILRRRGHAVRIADTGEKALNEQTPDVLIADVGLDGISGLDVLEEFGLRGAPPRCVVLSGLPSIESCRRAMQLGAVDFLTKPLDVDELVRVVEDDAPRVTARRGAMYSRSYLATEDAVQRGARDLAAYALRCGVGPAARARMASACAEALENAWRHAYPGQPGPVYVTADLDEREAWITVRDEGVGFDAERETTGSLSDCLDSGLARIATLAEDLTIEARPDHGTCVRALFLVHRVDFDEEAGLDLSELDWFAPETSRMVLAALADDEDDGSPFHLSPALAVSLGRLLAGPDPRRELQSALWS